MNDLIKIHDRQQHSGTGTAIAMPAKLGEDARMFLNASLSASTRRNYKAQFKVWCTWCDANERPILPSNPGDVANFVSERATAGQSVSTIRLSLAALRFANEAKGHEFNAKPPLISTVMKGITRKSNEIPK